MLAAAPETAGVGPNSESSGRTGHPQRHRAQLAVGGRLARTGGRARTDCACVAASECVRGEALQLPHAANGVCLRPRSAFGLPQEASPARRCSRKAGLACSAPTGGMGRFACLGTAHQQHEQETQQQQQQKYSQHWQHSTRSRAESSSWYVAPCKRGHFLSGENMPAGSCAASAKMASQAPSCAVDPRRPRPYLRAWRR